MLGVHGLCQSQGRTGELRVTGPYGTGGGVIGGGEE